jgi:hypothetical protein
MQFLFLDVGIDDTCLRDAVVLAAVQIFELSISGLFDKTLEFSQSLFPRSL